MDIKEHKKEIRKYIKSLKKGASAEDLAKQSINIQKRVEQIEDFISANTVLLYFSLPDEVNTEYLLSRWSNKLSGDKRIILPVVEGDILILKEYIPDEISQGYQNIYEPTGENVINPSEIEFAVIPGVAFDSKCNRMGRGKGFYDKLLPHLNCKCAALSFSFQIVDSVPCEEFDRPLDFVVTPNRIFSRLQM